MSPPLPREAAARRRRIAAPWRLAFVAYMLALVTGTHWPNLALGPEMPAADKMIHLGAFGTMTLLLWRTRWITRLWLLAIIALVWAATDEITQGIPGLGRTVAMDDYLAGSMGITIAIAWIWALGPLGIRGGANRLRLRLLAFSFDELFAGWKPWAAAIAGGLAGLIPLLALRPFLSVEGRQIAIMTALSAAAIITLLLWFRLWQRCMARLVKFRPCLECGEPTPPTASAKTDSPCAHCGTAGSAAQWVLPTSPLPRLKLAMSLRPALAGLALLLLGFGFIFISPFAYAMLLGSSSRSAWLAPTIVRFVGSLPPEFSNAIDFAALFLLLAILVRIYRRGLARFHDQAFICRGCGHDLRGTPVENSIGRCGECGMAFVRAATQSGEQPAPKMNADERG